MKAVIALISGLVSILAWWLKHRETPQAVMKRITGAVNEDMEKVNKAIAEGEILDIAAAFARLHTRILRETAGVDNPRSGNRKD